MRAEIRRKTVRMHYDLIVDEGVNSTGLFIKTSKEYVGDDLLECLEYEESKLSVGDGYIFNEESSVIKSKSNNKRGDVYYLEDEIINEKEASNIHKKYEEMCNRMNKYICEIRNENLNNYRLTTNQKEMIDKLDGKIERLHNQNSADQSENKKNIDNKIAPYSMIIDCMSKSAKKKVLSRLSKIRMSRPRNPYLLFTTPEERNAEEAMEILSD